MECAKNAIKMNGQGGIIMTHDITFCVSINCPYRFNCKRNVINNQFNENELVSQCDFSHTDTHCDEKSKIKLY